MADRPRLMLVTAAPLAMGGLENHLLALVEGLQSDYRFCLVGDLAEPFKSRWAKLGFPVIPFAARGKLDAAALLELRKIFREERPDVIHIHDSRAGLLGRAANIGLGIPLVYSIHYPSYQYVELSAARRRFNALVEGLFNRLLTDVVVFPYRNTYQEALDLGVVQKQKACLIPNGIDVQRFVRAAEALGNIEKTCGSNSPDVCRLLVVSRLSTEKNVRLAIQTTAELVGDGYLVGLMVAGDGPLRDELAAEVEELGIAGDVQFLGYRQDIPQLLAQADMLLMTSRFEAGPYVVMEAMSAGKPCVSTAVGDAPWLLADGAGVVVEESTPPRFAAAAAELIEDQGRRKRIGTLAQQKAISEFTLEHMMESYHRLYSDLIGGRR